MNWRHYLILFIVGLIVPFAVSRFQPLPGYMDADYYFAGGVQLAEGKGFTEPYLWNYLDNSQGLPHPSHTYWMPLASIVSAMGMWITGQSTYSAGRAAFILLSACVPLLVATLAYSVSRQQWLALSSGFLSIFSMYYAAFMPVPDNYALFMIFGCAFLMLAPHREQWVPIVLGALAGFLTLARSDGLLWLGLAALTVMWKTSSNEDGTRNTFTQWLGLVVPAGLLALFGYFIVMGGWHIRSWNLFGSFMAPGGGRLLWLENYNQTFMYPPENLTRESFLQAGWDAALQDRVAALTTNLGNTFAAQGAIFLFPLILLGLWQLRSDLRTRLAVTGWLILFVVMTVIFPFAGPRGSFFHAGAAFQPFWWVAAPIGMDVFLQWLRKRGQFNDSNAPILFQVFLVVLAAAMTGYLIHLRVISAGWATDELRYSAVEERFLDNGVGPQDAIVVRNPPGYFLASGRHAIALPFGDETTILTVAEKFGAKFLILEDGGTFDAIQDLYEHPEDNPSFTYLGEIDNARLYRIELAP